MKPGNDRIRDIIPLPDMDATDLHCERRRIIASKIPAMETGENKTLAELSVLSA